MGFMDKFKGFMGLPDDEYLDEEDEGFDEIPKKEEYHDYDFEDHTDLSDFGKTTTRYTSSTTTPPVDTIGSFSGINRDNKVVNIHATTQLQVVLVKPERFEDAGAVADHLNEKRTVVLNLESTSRDISRRLVDFLSGVAYANGGQIKKVANATFIITPYNVGVTGDSLLDELENNGVYF